MNWDDQLAPRYHLARRPDGSFLEIRRDPWEQQLLGFDRQTSRFVSIHALPPRSALPPATSLSVGERVYLAGRISHPGLFNVTDYGEREGCLFYVTELEEGEPVTSYLARQRSLPLAFALDLAVQLAALLRHLANFPRILGYVNADDLLVAPSTGHSLRLRLAGLGLNRPEQQPVPPSLQKSWLPQAAGLLWNLVGVSVRDDPQLKFSPQGSAVLLDPFRSFLDSAHTRVNCPAPQVFRELERELHRHLHRFLDILDPHRGWPCPDECVSLRPRSPLVSLLIEEGILPHWRDHNYEFAPELFCSHSRFALAARDVRTGTELAFQVLPPQAFLGATELQSVYRTLGQSSPAQEDSPLLRTFFLRSEETCTFFAEEAVHGFNLVDLLERRGRLSSSETAEILAGLDPVFQQLERSPGVEELITPWNIFFAFAPSASVEELSQCLTCRRLREWPSFRFRVRPGLTTVDLTRPIRSEWEEIVHRLSGSPRSQTPQLHRLDLSFAALTVFLLEYQRYRSLLVGGNPRPRAAVSCAKLQSLLAGTLLGSQPRSPDRRERFLQGLARLQGALAYPLDDARPSSPAAAKVQAGQTPAGEVLQPPGFAGPDAPSQAVRQRRITLLNRLVRRESSRMRMKQSKTDQMSS